MRAHLGLAVAVVLIGAAAPVRAQEEIIEDPELAGAPLAAPAAAEAAPTLTAPSRGAIRLAAETRVGVDTDWDRSTGEDVALHRVRLDAELSQDVGPHARVLVSGRIEHTARVQPGDVPDRVDGTLETRLLDTWLDARLGPLDVRAGNQVISWGRVGVLSPGEVWNSSDLRDPFVEAESLPVVPVPALRVDASTLAGIGVSLAWQPFFVPMRADVLGTDQALLGPGAPPALAGLASPLARLFGQGTVLPLDDPALGGGPRQNLAASQVGARVTAEVGEASLGATVFWGLSKIPTVEPSPELRAAIDAGPDDALAWLSVLGALADGRTLLETEYERNLQLAVDAQAPAGGALVSLELGWAPRRALYEVDEDACRASCVVHRGVIEAAAQIERVEDDYQIVVEALALAATAGARTGELLFFGPGRTVVGAVGTFRWAPPDGDWDLSASAVALTPGPSATGVLRLGRRLGDHVRLEAGLLWTEATSDAALAPSDGGDMAFAAVRVTN